MKRRIFKTILLLILSVQLSMGNALPLLAAEISGNEQTERSQEPVAEEAAKKYIGKEQIKEVSASSFQAGYESEKAVDGIENDANNCWHTPWDADAPGFPHWFQVEFKEQQLIDSLVYVARKADGFQFITSYEVWVSPNDKVENLSKVAEGTWSRAKTATAEFAPINAKIVRFVAKEKTDTNKGDNYSVSASEIKFGIYVHDAEEYNKKIKEKESQIDKVLDYAQKDSGKGEHQFKQDKLDSLTDQKIQLEKLIDSSDVEAVNAALAEADMAIAGVMESNKTEEEDLLAQVSKDVMSAEANTQNDGYEAEKAIDGNLDTMWHTQWSPEVTKHPHELTIDLGRTLLLDTVTITPRRDMGTGRIKSGELYAGNDKDKLELVTTFAATDIATLSIPYTSARYIMIKALEGTDQNTAIAEVDVTTYDRGYVKLMDVYRKAENMLGNAQTGDEIGQFSKEDKKAFETKLAAFAEKIEGTFLNSECYKLADEIEIEKTKFADKVKRYVLKDLKKFIEEGKELAERLEGKDREYMQKAVLDAQKVVDDKESTAIEIHNAAAALRASIDSLSIVGEDHFDLSGKWDFYMGSYEADVAMSDTVVLPGTLDENKKGDYNSFRDPRRLSRYYIYTGPASYQKQVFVPYSWENKKITLFMERSRETQVWVNGTEVSTPDSANLIAVSQVYDLTEALRFGELNTITIEVDNSYPNTPRAAITNSSMATEETQTNWNGIVGTFELQVNEQISVTDLRVYPNEDLKSVSVEVEVENRTAEKVEGNVTVQAEGLGARKIPVSLDAGTKTEVSITDYAMGDNVKLWSEFEQNLYTMTVSIENGSSKTEKFGMRVFKVDDSTKQLTNNGNKVFLRSEANCAVFPLTAYAPMDEAGWEKLFSSYKSYGINAVRFHSWCPPDAAFRVADRMGMFLQPELSSWDAGSMFEAGVEQEYYGKEAKAIVKEYANHPSFVMFTFGNELVFAEGGYEYADSLIQELQAQDHTRLYSFASNAGYGGTKPTANSDFFTGQVYRGKSLRGIYAGMSGFINQSRPATTVNYEEAVNYAAADAGVPAFSFEVGQFQVFPDVLTELEQYTGVLEPRNLQLVEERLKKNNISDKTVEKWINASGMLSKIGYRMEIEATLRTKNMSGISLLGIQDFSGQSTALVGMMNAMGDPKPYDFAAPSEFATFFSPEVALLETEKFTWNSDENFTGKLEIANYGAGDLQGSMFYRLENGAKVVAEGKLEAVNFPQGEVGTGGEISIPLGTVKEAAQLKLTIGLGDIENYYDIWVYPAGEKAVEGDVYITEFLNEEAKDILEDGGKVFIAPRANKATLPNSITGTFTTAFWSSQFVSESQPGSMGLLMDPEHPVFDGFPTEYHSNYQWWPMAKLGRPMILEDMTQEDGTKIQPLVQVLDSFSTVRTMGLLYEAKVGEGKLMVSSMGLDQLQAEYPEARALKNSILNYMNSDAFEPQFEVAQDKIEASVIGTETDPRLNVAEKSNGGNIELGENTKTCQIGYDNNPQDRALELNDGRVDVEVSSRSWTDWNAEGVYPDAEVTSVFDKEYVVDEVELPFYEDYGCKAPAQIKVEYFVPASEEGGGGRFMEVSNPSQTSGFVKGSNSIKFDAVTTSKIRITMVHQEGMGVALSEIIIYEKQIPAEKVKIVTEDDKTTVKLGQTLQLGVKYEPENANDTAVRWKVLDEDGNKSNLAKVSISGMMKPSATGIVFVEAYLRSNEEISDTIQIKIVAEDKEKLETLIKKAEKVDKDKYTVNGYKEFKKVLDYAKEVCDKSDASEKEIADAVSGLEMAFTNLEKTVRATKVQMNELKTAIKDAEKLAKKYPKYAEELEKVIKDAKDILEKGAENLTQREVDGILGKLKTVIDKVQKKVEASKPDNSDKNSEIGKEDGKESGNVKTGDNTNLVIPITMLMAAAVVIMIAFMRKKKGK